MTRNQLMSLELNTVVKYGMFSSVLFKGKDESYVHLQDREGSKKKVYIDLFLKHASVIN